MKSIVAEVLIRLPFPFYIDMKTAGNWMKWRFEDSIAMQHAANHQAEQWEYYARFIAQYGGFWLPVGYGADAKYQWVRDAETSSKLCGREVTYWSKDRPTLVGRFSLWAAFAKMRRLEKSFSQRSPRYRRTLKDKLRTLVAQLKAAIASPPQAKPWVPPAYEAVPLSENTIEQLRAALADVPEIDFEMPITEFPAVDLELKPKDVAYNWKTTQLTNQYTYRKAGWKNVQPKRHPELVDFKVGRRIVWGGMVLMECSSVAYAEMQAEDYDIATSQFSEPVMRDKKFTILDQLNIKAEDEK